MNTQELSQSIQPRCEGKKLMPAKEVALGQQCQDWFQPTAAPSYIKQERKLRKRQPHAAKKEKSSASLPSNKKFFSQSTTEMSQLFKLGMGVDAPFTQELGKSVSKLGRQLGPGTQKHYNRMRDMARSQGTLNLFGEDSEIEGFSSQWYQPKPARKQINPETLMSYM